MSLLSDAISFGLGVVRGVAGERVVYEADGGISFMIESATPLVGRQKEDLADRIAVQSNELDWGVPRSAMWFDGNEIIPAKGHVIRRTIGGRTERYALTPRDGDQPWSWSDEGGHTQYRLHTLMIGVS